MNFQTRPELAGNLGMVTSTHWLASAAGMSVLERGGNAADAAVAAGLVLQVVLPDLNGPAGDLSALVHEAGPDRVSVISAQGTAPGAATARAFRDLGLSCIPGDGLLAAAVPGAFAGWMALLRDFGTWTLRDVLEPAIGYAEHGFPAAPSTCSAIRGVEELFGTDWPESGRLWLPGGAVPRPGQRLRNEPLAALYRRLVTTAEKAAAGRETQIEAALTEWYEGSVAAAIEAYARSARIADSTGERHATLLSAADLAGWRAGLEDPLTLEYAGYQVHKTRPWGQGPVFLQQLALLSGLGLRDMEPDGPDFLHTVVEAAKLALADRDAWYGDPSYVPDLTGELLAEDYTVRRRALVGDQASTELRPGSPGGREPRLPTPGEAPQGMMFAGAWRPGDTCHLDVADRFGTMVSATPSRGWLQGSPALPGLGFCLSTSAQLFSIEDGLPNTIAPGKRPRSTLSPTIAERDDARLAFGTPGGDLQDQWSLLFFLRHVHGGGDLQAAVEAPAVHTGHFVGSFFPHVSHPGVVAVEDRLPEETIAELRRRGHRVMVRPSWALGRVCAVASEGGFLRAAASPRGGTGYAVGR